MDHMLQQTQKRWPALLGFVILIAVIDIVSGLLTFPQVKEWYPTLVKPFWSPPNWLFGPVWTVLYIMLAISGYKLWISQPGSFKDKFQSPALNCYFIQLFFNAVWTPLFFSLHLKEAALIALVSLDIFALMTLYFSYKAGHKAVAWMFVPYCLWVLFATSLNGAIVYLN